jgi:hypothetical protein
MKKPGTAQWRLPGFDEKSSDCLETEGTLKTDTTWFVVTIIAFLSVTPDILHHLVAVIQHVADIKTPDPGPDLAYFSHELGEQAHPNLHDITFAGALKIFTAFLFILGRGAWKKTIGCQTRLKSSQGTKS